MYVKESIVFLYGNFELKHITMVRIRHASHSTPILLMSSGRIVRFFSFYMEHILT